MKYVFIEKHQAEFRHKAMCRVLRWPAAAGIRGVSGDKDPTRQQFRQHGQRCPSRLYPVKQRYGAPRLTDEIRTRVTPLT